MLKDDLECHCTKEEQTCFQEIAVEQQVETIRNVYGRSPTRNSTYYEVQCSRKTGVLTILLDLETTVSSVSTAPFICGSGSTYE